MDTGVGVDAYSVIEQGRVGELLEANPKERRLIFEEAAGISKFEAQEARRPRKLGGSRSTCAHESPRKVEKRLRSVKVQAAGPELPGILRPPRRAAYWEWRRTSTANSRRPWKPNCGVLAELQAEVAGADRQTDELEEAVSGRSRPRGFAHPRRTACATRRGALADARQQLAGHESTLKHERTTPPPSTRPNFSASVDGAARARRPQAKVIEADAARTLAESAAAERRTWPTCKESGRPGRGPFG